MLAGLEQRKCKVNHIDISYRTTGQGPALLMLHGHPQTHMMWHKVAPALAQHFTIVTADLRGYGDSDKPVSPPGRSLYSKRLMAQDMRELMNQLGFSQFYVLAHDRGARVAHRLALVYADSPYPFPGKINRKRSLTLSAQRNGGSQRGYGAIYPTSTG